MPLLLPKQYKRSAFYHVRMTDEETIKNSNGFIKKALYICEVFGALDNYDNGTECWRASEIAE